MNIKAMLGTVEQFNAWVTANKAKLSDDDKQWLAAWQRYSSYITPGHVTDRDLARIRYGHYSGWYACKRGV